MSDTTNIQQVTFPTTLLTHQLYPVSKDDIESEKEILDAILKIEPLDIQFKLLAINHNLLKLKNLESNEQAEIAAKDAETARNFQVHCPTVSLPFHVLTL